MVTHVHSDAGVAFCGDRLHCFDRFLQCGVNFVALRGCGVATSAALRATLFRTSSLFRALFPQLLEQKAIPRNTLHRLDHE